MPAVSQSLRGVRLSAGELPRSAVCERMKVSAARSWRHQVAFARRFLPPDLKRLYECTADAVQNGEFPRSIALPHGWFRRQHDGYLKRIQAERPHREIRRMVREDLSGGQDLGGVFANLSHVVITLEEYRPKDVPRIWDVSDQRKVFHYDRLVGAIGRLEAAGFLVLPRFKPSSIREVVTLLAAGVLPIEFPSSRPAPVDGREFYGADFVIHDLAHHELFTQSFHFDVGGGLRSRGIPPHHQVAYALMPMRRAVRFLEVEFRDRVWDRHTVARLLALFTAGHELAECQHWGISAWNGRVGAVRARPVLSELVRRFGRHDIFHETFSKQSLSVREARYASTWVRATLKG